MLVIIGATLLVAWMVYPRASFSRSKKWPLRLATGAIIFLCNYKLNTSYHLFQRKFIPADIHAFYSIRSGFSAINPEIPLKHLTTEKNISPGTESPKWNVVLFIFESFSKEPLSFYGYDNEFTPFMHQWITGEQDQFVLMQNSISVSGATDVSMPTIFTGVGPEKSYGVFTHAPFIWDYAKRNGYTTFYASSQSQIWKNLMGFIGISISTIMSIPKNLTWIL